VNTVHEVCFVLWIRASILDYYTRQNEKKIGFRWVKIVNIVITLV